MTEIDAEAWVISTEEGQRLLDEMAGVTLPGPADVARWRKRSGAPEIVAAGLRIVACRRKAKGKFSQGDRMWLDPVGLEQATAEKVARHKALRFHTPLVVDLCAGIGGDSLALARRVKVLAVDLDQGMCRRLHWNAHVHEVGNQVQPVQGRAEDFPIPEGAWAHVDPDRRARGQGRARRIADYQPGPEFLEGLVRRVTGGAIKLSPAADFSAFLPGHATEVELISLDGECKEAAVWFGEAVTCRRRATRLPENVTWTDRDGGRPYPEWCPVGDVSNWVYDPDPSLIRAGLLDSFALAHDLARISGGVDYLTGTRLIDSPFLTAFAVRGVYPLDLKRLRRLASELNLGPLEIKSRGLDLAPEALRTRLRPHGSETATLILAGGKGPARAILAQRISGAGSTSSPADWGIGGLPS